MAGLLKLAVPLNIPVRHRPRPSADDRRLRGYLRSRLLDPFGHPPVAPETDVGEPLPDLLAALEEAKARMGRATTPEQRVVRQAREASSMTFYYCIVIPTRTIKCDQRRKP